jgi:hypothetical protein
MANCSDGSLKISHLGNSLGTFPLPKELLVLPTNTELIRKYENFIELITFSAQISHFQL